MRNKLQRFLGTTSLFTAVFIGVRRSKTDQKTILLRDVRHNGKLISDHCWITFTGEFKRLDPPPNSKIEFTSQVTKYRTEQKLDYQLRRVHNVKIIS